MTRLHSSLNKARNQYCIFDVNAFLTLVTNDGKKLMEQDSLVSMLESEYKSVPDSNTYSETAYYLSVV